MEQKRLIRNNSDKQMQKIIIKEKKEPKIKIKRRNNKSRTIIGKNISIFSDICSKKYVNLDFIRQTIVDVCHNRNK